MRAYVACALCAVSIAARAHPLDYFRPLVYDVDDDCWEKGHDAREKFRDHCN